MVTILWYPDDIARMCEVIAAHVAAAPEGFAGPAREWYLDLDAGVESAASRWPDRPLEAELVVRGVTELIAEMAPPTVGCQWHARITRAIGSSAPPRASLNEVLSSAMVMVTPLGRIECDGLVIDEFRRVCSVDAVDLDLTDTEQRLLFALTSQRSRVLSYEQLNAVCRAGPSTAKPGLQARVRGLRQKLGRHGRRIVGVRGVGYRFDTSRPGGRRLDAGDVSVDPGAHRAYRGSRLLCLGETEFVVLSELAQHPDATVTYESLHDALGGLGRQSLSTAIGRIRAELGGGQYELLETVLTVGYRLRSTSWTERRLAQWAESGDAA